MPGAAEQQIPLPVIAGPTAGGKTAVAVELALLLPTGGEIISADSMQIYRGMDIGTAKPLPTERRGVPHHLLDLIDPTGPEGPYRFTVDDWLSAAEKLVQEIRERGKVPIVAGGTNLYLQAFLYGMFKGPEPDPQLRKELETQETEQLREQLCQTDPAAAERIHRNDRRRTIRALEVYRLTGQRISDLQKQWDNTQSRPNTRLFILQWSAEQINRRINRRVKEMMESGLLEEARRLHEAGLLRGQAGEALGYKQLLTHLRGKCTLEEATEKIKIETRRFARNQRTWLRRLSATRDAVILPMEEGESSPQKTAQVIARHILSKETPSETGSEDPQPRYEGEQGTPGEQL